MNHLAGNLSVGVLLVACGGTSSIGGGTGGSGGAGGSGGFPIPGSYDLAVGKVTATPQSTVGPPSPNVTPPSEGRTMRLDVRKGTAGSVDGVLTPRWGAPAHVDGARETGEYRFTGDVSVSGTDSSANVTDQWSTLHVAASGSGLGTNVTMEGTENVFQGDVLWTFDLRGTATLANDDTAPELRSAPTSPRGPSDALLPWDPIEVDVAEPVAGAAIESKTSVLLSDVDHAGELTPLPIGWHFAPTDTKTSWAGIVRAEARLSGWDHHPTQTAKPYTLRAEAGIVDAVGLGSAAVSASFAVLDVGQPQPSFPFDRADAPAPVTWGLVALRAGAGARCEQGGCLEIGPYETTYCGTGRHGIAGRVSAPTGSLDVRYRVLYAASASSPDEPPSPYGPAFTIEIARAGAEAIARQVQSPPGTSLLDLGAAAGELRWATPWTTESVSLPGPLPPMVIDLGFSIGSADSSSTWCGGGPLPPPVKTLVVLDALTGH